MSGNNRWDDASTRKFLELCVEDAKKGNSKLRMLVSVLNAQHGKKFNVKQVRNHYNDWRSKFRAWEVLETWTSLAFDPTTGVPLVDDDERWNSYVEKYKRHGAAGFRNKPLPHLDLLRYLFKGKGATGVRNFTSGMGSDALFSQGSQGVKRMSIGSGEGSGDSDEQVSLTEQQTRVHNYNSDEESRSPQRSKSPPRSTSSSKRKSFQSNGRTTRKRQTIEIDKAIQELREKGKELVGGSSNVQGSKYKLVAACLTSMESVAIRGSAYYVEVMEFLRQGDNGDFFLALPDDEKRLM